jgi:hypothetical protein
MIGAVGLDLAGDVVDLSFRRPPLGNRSGRPVLIGIGDSVAGPLVGLFYDAPSTPEQLAGPPDLTPAHSHPCDNFRVVLVGELWVGQERYHPGEFRLQRSGRPYGRDGDAPHPDGNWRIIFFADRRGHRVRPTNPELRAQSASAEAIRRTQEHYGDLLPVILPDEDDGVDGLVTTITTPFSRVGHVDGSFDDADTWEPLGSSRAAVSLLGVHDVGPVVILQRTPPGELAAPAVRFGSDVFRAVIGGSHDRSGPTVAMGDTLTRAAGLEWEQVVAGPQGLDELIIIGDRRGADPEVVAGDPGWASDLVAVLARLRAGLPGLAAAVRS